MEVDRVYLFESHTDPETGKNLISQKIEWAADNAESQINNPDLQNIEQGNFPELVSKIVDNEYFQAMVSELPEGPIKELLASQNIKSILMIPILVEDEFYGFIGFDDCKMERTWENEEIQYLQTIASNISGAIRLRNTTEKLQFNEQRFRSIVQDGADLISILDEDAIYKYVSPNTNEVMGVPSEEFIGKNVLEFIHQEDRERVASTLDNLENGQRQQIAPFRFKLKDTQWFWIETTVTNLLDNPAIKGFLANSRDVTERIERQEKLRELSLVASKTTDLVVITDHEERITWVNKAFEKLTGFTLEEIKGEKPGDFLQGPETDIATIKRIREALENAKSIEETILNYNKNGESYWLNMSIDPIFNDEGECTHFIAIERDVTEKIKRQEKLRELSLVASKTTEMVVITDKESRTTWVNNAFEKLTGYTLEEMKGERPGNILRGADTDMEKTKRIREAQANFESIEETNLYYKKDGEPVWLNLSIDPILNDEGECTHIISILRDVTEKIEKAKELQQSLERYDIVNKATSDTIWDLDLHTDKMVFNSNIYDMFGYDDEQVKEVGTWWRNKIHPDDLPSVDKVISEVLETGKERYQVEYRFRTAGGQYKHVFDRAFVMKDEKGKPFRMIGAMQDVTHEVEEEERLKLLESVITNTSESVVILEATPGEYGREIVYVNEAFTELTGYEKDDVIGETLHFLNGPETSRKTRNELRRAMENFEAVEVEFINYRKNGDKFWINTSMVPVADKKGDYTHWVAIGRDITDQKRNEKEIKASLAEKETLLAEIHHRVKNNLAVVSGMMQLQAYDSTNKDLQDKLYDSVVRIKTMATVHELLYESNSFSQLEFSETLQKLVENVSETLQTNSKVALDIECDAIKLNINQAIPASLIVNEVITNAYKHAFKNKENGKLTFRLKEQNNHVRIEIADNGVGLPKKEKTTQNSSLGLHLIEVLSNQIDATYEFKNREPGTVFSMSFEKKETKSRIGNSFD